MTGTAFGPQGPNYTTTRPPADPQASAGVDTFFKNCSSAGAKDGTFATADFFNVHLANMRYLVRTANVALNDADDTMLYQAVHAIAAAVASGSSSGGTNYAVDTGVANALTVTLPAVAAYGSGGLEIFVKVKVTNTGASTITVNTLGAISIIHGDGSAVAAGELVAGEVAALIFDGTYFQLQNVLAKNVKVSRFVTFTTPGTTYWTCPADVTSVKATGGGAGGGGGGSYGAGAGAGGNGGAGFEGNFPVVPGTVYAITIGAGGAGGGPGSAGATGGSTLFASFAIATGGGGGGQGSNGAGVTGSGAYASVSVSTAVLIGGTSGQYGQVNGSIGVAQGGAGGSGPFGFTGPAFSPPCLGTTLNGYTNNFGGGGSGAGSITGAGGTGGTGGNGFLTLEY